MTPEEEGQSRASILAGLATDLGSHYFWLPRLFKQAGAWRWLVPWPGLALAALVTRPRALPKDHGSAWLTAVGVIALIAGQDRLEALDAKFAADASRTLFAAAFLIMTMLSLSVALPGQAIIKLVLGKNPRFVAEFVTPTLWAFLWGVTAGTALAFYGRLSLVCKLAASIVALYAFAMEINAILYTVRVYAIGLVLTAHAEGKDHKRSSERAP